MGRWSRGLAPLFVSFAGVRDGESLLDVGSGTGALAAAVAKVSSITSATMDAAGRYVAFSTTTALSIGHVRDAVVVLRTADGREVFRRFLPTYSRTNVAFIGEEYFAYSDLSATHVMRVAD